MAGESGLVNKADLDLYQLYEEIATDTAQAYAIEQGWVDPEKQIILPNPIDGN